MRGTDIFFVQPEAKKIRFEREYAARQAKKQKRPKKIYAMTPGDGKKKGKGGCYRNAPLSGRVHCVSCFFRCGEGKASY